MGTKLNLNQINRALDKEAIEKAKQEAIKKNKFINDKKDIKK